MRAQDKKYITDTCRMKALEGRSYPVLSYMFAKERYVILYYFIFQ